ncbi:MAG: hypothetical protein J7M29_10930 [Verrucomicrobia bacterium]|nr:hypothetical protein [Verrucomicrobiota bacterium]
MRTKILGKLLPALIALGAGGLGFAQSWTSQDIGNPSVPGSTDDPNGAVRTIVGGGADIWNNADHFHFNWTKVVGAFDIQVRVQSLDMANTWSKAGIFARETLEPGSRNVGILVTPTDGQNLFNMQWRDSTDGGSGSKPSAERYSPVPYPNAWIRLVRPDVNSNEFVSYIDESGASSTTPTWVEYHRHTIPGELLPETLYVGLGVTSHNDATSTTAVFSDITLNAGAFVPGVAPVIVEGPQDVTVEAGSPATFSVTINEAEVFPPPSFEWFKDDVAIPGATGPTCTIDRPALADNGAKIKVVVSNCEGAVTSEEATLTVSPDTVPPTLEYATGSYSFMQVTAVFSEPLDPATAEDPANYALSGGVTVTDAALAAPAGTPGDNVVVLTTTYQVPGTALTLTVNNVTDVAGNPVAAGSSVRFGAFAWQEGVVRHEYWENVSGGLLGLKSDPRYPYNPSWTGLEPRTEYPRDGANEGGNNYGNKLSCWVIPQKTTSYVFFVSSDDPSELYLSPDENPADAVLIARQRGWTGPRIWRTAGGGGSDPLEMNSWDAMWSSFISQWPELGSIQLEAGKKYYLYAIHTEGGGGDNLAVTMVTEDDFFNLDIPQDGDAPTLEGPLVGTYVDPNSVLKTGLSITPTPAGFDLAWESLPGVRYNVWSSPDIAAPLSAWTLVEGDIDATPPANTLSVPSPATSLFYVVEACLPPSSVVFSENFDDVSAPSLPAGWTCGANSGTTAWELGTPSSVGPAGSSSSPNCVGTKIDGNYGLNADIWLRSGPIDLTAYTEGVLRFREFKDIALVGDDFGTVRILAADDQAELAVLQAKVKGFSNGWGSYGAILPAKAFAEPILIEFQFHTDSDDSHLGIRNAGFEDPRCEDGDWGPAIAWTEGYYDTANPGVWVSSSDGYAGLWNPDENDGYSGGAAPEGQNIGWTDSTANADVGLSQVLDATLQANTEYVLSVRVGNPFYNGSDVTANYRIELLAGGALLQSESGASPPMDTWVTHTLTYNSGPNPEQLGQPLEIRLIAEAYVDEEGYDEYEVNWDEVTLTVNPPQRHAGWYIDDVEIAVPGQ